MAKGAKSRDKTDRDPVLVDFALQGGGSHGRVHLGRARPISRGALAQGRSDIGHVRRRDERGSALHPTANEGGTEGARVALDAYWGRVAKAARFSPLQRSPLDRMMNRWTLDTSPAYLAMDLMSRVFSPYDMNPSGRNPISAFLAESIDFAHDQAVHHGNQRAHRPWANLPQPGDHARRASRVPPACRPCFQAIEIDGEPYWDGGYAGNPTITPLVRESDAHDTILDDSLPHNGAVVTLLSVCGSTHKESYKDVFMVAILGAIIALVVVILLGSIVGSF